MVCHQKTAGSQLGDTWEMQRNEQKERTIGQKENICYRRCIYQQIQAGTYSQGALCADRI